MLLRGGEGAAVPGGTWPRGRMTRKLHPCCSVWDWLNTSLTPLPGGIEQRAARRCHPRAICFSSHVNIHLKLCKGSSGESKPFQSEPKDLANNGSKEEGQYSHLRIIMSTLLGDVRVRVQLPSSLGMCCGWTRPQNLLRHSADTARSPLPVYVQHRILTTAYTTYPSKELNIPVLSAILYFIRNVFTQLGPCFVLIPKARCNIIVWQGKDIWKTGETNPWITY